MQVTSLVSLSLCCFFIFIPPPNENKISCWLVFGSVGNHYLQKRSSVLIDLGAVPVLLFLRRSRGSAGIVQLGSIRRWSETPWLPSSPIRGGCSLAVSPPTASWMHWSTMCPARDQHRAAEEGDTTAPPLSSLQSKREGASLSGHGTHTCQGRKKVLRTGKIALN